MKIRKLKTSELDLLKGLVLDFTKSQNEISLKINRVFKLFNSNNVTNFRELKSAAKKNMRAGKGSIFAVFDKEKPVGYIYVIVEKLPSYAKLKKRGYVCSIVVDKKYRRKGVATKLFNEAKKWFKSKNLKYVAIGVLCLNHKAISAYRKWGFFQYMNMMMGKI